MKRALLITIALAVLASAWLTRTATQGVPETRQVSSTAQPPRKETVSPNTEATIYTAREIVTLDPAAPNARAVAVLGDRILAVNGHSIVGADYQRFVHDILGTPMI